MGQSHPRFSFRIFALGAILGAAVAGFALSERSPLRYLHLHPRLPAKAIRMHVRDQSPPKTKTSPKPARRKAARRPKP